MTGDKRKPATRNAKSSAFERKHYNYGSWTAC